MKLKFFLFLFMLSSSGLYAQFQVSIMPFAYIDTYQVEHSPGQEYILSGFEQFKEEGEFMGYGTEINIWYQYKEKDNFRLDINYTAFDAEVYFSNGLNKRTFGNRRVPFNVKFAYFKTYSPTEEISLNFGLGLGAKYFFGSFNNWKISGSTHFNDADDNSVRFSGDTDFNSVSFYVPLYIGFEFQVVGRVKMFSEFQIHRNLYPKLGSLNFEIEDTRQEGVEISPKVTYGNYILLGLGLKIDLQKKPKPHYVPSKEFREKILKY